jgi:hypothetical protein
MEHELHFFNKLIKRGPLRLIFLKVCCSAAARALRKSNFAGQKEWSPKGATLRNEVLFDDAATALSFTYARPQANILFSNFWRRGKQRAKNRPRYRFAKRLTLFNLQVSLKIHELCCCLSRIICNSVTSSLPAGCKGGCHRRRRHHRCSLLLRASERTNEAGRRGEENVIETRPSAAQCQINSYELISLFANALKLLTAG